MTDVNRMTFDYEEHEYSIEQPDGDGDLIVKVYRNGEYIGRVTGGDIFDMATETPVGKQNYNEILDREVNQA